MINDYTINILDTIEKIESYREVWGNFNQHINSDLDHFITVILSRDEILQPYVIVINKDDQPAAILVGRIEDIPFEMSFGYKTIMKPVMRHLTIIYGGIFGDINQILNNEIISILRNVLKQKVADLILFRNLPIKSMLFEAGRSIPFFMQRDFIIQPSVHWQIKLPDSFNDYFSQLSRRTRSNFNNYSNRVRKTFKGEYEIKIITHADHIEMIFNDLESIAQKTYHRQLGFGFFNTVENKKRFKLGFDKGWLKVYILYIKNKPVAYWVGWKYREVFYTDYTGYDSDYNNYRVGNFLLLKIIEDCCNDEIVRTIDFGFGDAQYKRILSNFSWEESQLYIFSLTMKTVCLNILRIIINKFSKFIQVLLIKMNMLEKVKKVWRTRTLNN